MPQLKFAVTNIDRVVKPTAGKVDTLFWDTETMELRATPTGKGTSVHAVAGRSP